jgi:hypothetical protein
LTRCVFSLAIVVAAAACADPAAEQTAREREAARIQVLGDAMFYYRCTHQAHQFAGECDRWRKAYEEDYAAFIGKYGKSAQ